MEASEKKMSKKLQVILALTLVGVLLLGVGVTLAIQSRSSEKVENQFQAKDVEVTNSIYETFPEETVVTGKEYAKEVAVKNEGTARTYVRVRVLVSPESVLQQGVSTDLGTRSDKWVDGGDGFWYYAEALAPGASTELLMSKVMVAADVAETDFDITAYEESVIAVGTGTPDLAAIKAVFVAAETTAGAGE